METTRFISDQPTPVDPETGTETETLNLKPSKLKPESP